MPLFVKLDVNWPDDDDVIDVGLDVWANRGTSKTLPDLLQWGENLVLPASLATTGELADTCEEGST